MEAYRSKCPDCGVEYSWTGFGTGLGKSNEQLAQMKKDQTVYRECSSDNLKADLDHKSKEGKRQDEACKAVLEILFGKTQ